MERDADLAQWYGWHWLCTGRAVLCYIAMQKHNEFSRVKTPRSCDPLLSPLCGGKAATWVYFDEIYLLLRDSLSANFLYTSWKRFRKYNAYATGITQNVQDCLTNDTAYAMLANSEFVVMLRQTKDIDSVVELYGLSEPQRKYLLLAQPGEGIIKMGNSLIPFNNPQPKDTKTYKLLTTKPGEME